MWIWFDGGWWDWDGASWYVVTDVCGTWSDPLEDLDPGFAIYALGELQASGGNPVTERGDDGTLYLFTFEDSSGAMVTSGGYVTVRYCLDGVSTMGQTTAPMVWSEILPGGNGFAFEQGNGYAILASVSKNYTLQQVQTYLTNNGWTVVYAWEYGTPGRNQYAVDDWLASLPADTTSNHRWVYGEAGRSGANTTIGQNAPWPLTIYEIAHVFEAVPGQPNQAPGSASFPTSTAPACPAPSSTLPYALGGVALGAVAATGVALLL